MGISTGLAVAAAAYLLLAPIVTIAAGTVTLDPAGAATTAGETRSVGLIQSQGWNAALVLLVPIVLTLIPFFARHGERARSATLGSAIGLLAFVVLTGFSIGLFYLPSGMVMLAAAGLSQSRLQPRGI